MTVLAPLKRGAFLPTNEDWAPTFSENLVRLSLLHLSDGQWRVCVWGADDFGMEIDLPTRDQAEAAYRRIPIPVTQGILYALGFKRA